MACCEGLKTGNRESSQRKLKIVLKILINHFFGTNLIHSVAARNEISDNRRLQSGYSEHCPKFCTCRPPHEV